MRFKLTLGVGKTAMKTTLFIKVHENELEAALMSAHPSNRRQRYRQWSHPSGHIDKELAKIIGVTLALLLTLHPFTDKSSIIANAP